jgi:hypothetical protein
VYRHDDCRLRARLTRKRSKRGRQDRRPRESRGHGVEHGVGCELHIRPEPCNQHRDRNHGRNRAPTSELRRVVSGRVYPTPPPDLDCKGIPYRNFRVIYTVPDPDPHGFDSDRDGIGCET